MPTVPALTRRTEAQRWREVRDEDAPWGDLRPELLEAIQRILKATMEDELESELVAAHHERIEAILPLVTREPGTSWSSCPGSSPTGPSIVRSRDPATSTGPDPRGRGSRRPLRMPGIIRA